MKIEILDIPEAGKANALNVSIEELKNKGYETCISLDADEMFSPTTIKESLINFLEYKKVDEKTVLTSIKAVPINPNFDIYEENYTTSDSVNWENKNILKKIAFTLTHPKKFIDKAVNRAFGSYFRLNSENTVNGGYMVIDINRIPNFEGIIEDFAMEVTLGASKELNNYYSPNTSYYLVDSLEDRHLKHERGMRGAVILMNHFIENRDYERLEELKKHIPALKYPRIFLNKYERNLLRDAGKNLKVDPNPKTWDKAKHR